MEPILTKRKRSQSIEMQNDLPQQTQEPPARVFLSNIEPHMDELQILKLVRKVVKKEDTGLVSILKPRKQGHAILKFKTEDEKMTFESIVHQEQTKCKSRKIKLKPVNKSVDGRQEVSVDHILKKQNQAAEDRQLDPKPEDVQEIGKQSIVDKICPLHNLPYSEQIQHKRQHLEKIINNLNEKLKENPLQQPLTLSHTIEADQLTKYRNKEEFTFGFDHLNQLNVGFTKGDFQKRVVLVDTPDSCLIASDISIEIAQLVQNLARKWLQTQEVQPYNKLRHKGFWRNMVVRDSCNTKQVIVNLVVADSQIDEKNLELIKEDLKQIFIQHFENHSFQLKCLCMTYWNDCSDCVPTHITPQFLIGSQNAYEETILDKRFLVSSNAFLQIHIPQCNKLYASVQEELEIDDQTTFLDICSGIGTIGLCMASKANSIVQVEMIESACEDAKKNAELNSIKNVDVYASKIEDCVKEICKIHEGKRLVGVVDPPRNGLHPSVCGSLRTLKGLNKLVYIACNASAVQDNLLYLCLNENKNKRKGPSFRITKVYQADLFPQTSHYETVFVLER